MSRRIASQVCLGVFVVALMVVPFSAEALIDAPFIDEGLFIDEPEPPQTSMADLRLLQNGFIVTERTFHQVHDPYINADAPIFITTDTLLNAFHTLWRESLYRVESANVDRFTRTLKWIWSQIEPDEDPHRAPPSRNAAASSLKKRKGSTDDRLQQFIALRQAAMQKARLAIAVALNLMDDKALQLSGQLKKKVETESKRILKAKGSWVPAWFGASGFIKNKIDYACYQPYGFYQFSNTLSRYFKAVKWLQNVPFRVAKDDELLAIMILGQTLNITNPSIDGDRLDVGAFFTGYRELAGYQYQWDLLLAAQIVRDRPGNLDTVRRYLTAIEPGVDGEAHPHTSERRSPLDHERSRQTQFHVLMRPIVPEALLFQETALFGNTEHSPSGLEVMAVLGSHLAEQRMMVSLPERKHSAFLQTIDAAASWFEGRTIYHQYLHCLAALLDDPEPDVPFFMISDKWRYKNVNTALAGWTQYRGRWNLPSNQTVAQTEPADRLKPRGFVEPEPEFYARFDEFVDRLMAVLERCGVFVSAQHQIAEDLRFTAQLIREMKYPQEGPLSEHLNDAEIYRVEHSMLSLAALVNARYLDEDFKQRRSAVVFEIEKLAEEIQGGWYDQDPTFQAMVLETHSNLKAHWQTLSQMCRRLEILSHKQLRGVLFNERDNFFISEFGSTLASLIPNGRNSHNLPYASGPVLIKTHPAKRKNESLYTGIGYPQQIVVLYPYGGEVVRCYGAVLPYFEFISTDAFSAEEWNDRLASDTPPPHPVWFRDVITPTQLSKAVE